MEIDDEDFNPEIIDLEKPIKAESYFWVSKLIIQVIKFRYHDPNLNYVALENSNALISTLEKIKLNMQYFIDEDSFYLNDSLLSFIVDEVRLEYFNEKPDYPVLIFRIKAENKVHLYRKQKNIIELVAELEEVQYPVFSEWTLPRKIFDVQTGMNVSKLSDNKLVLEAEPGMIIGGEEKIVFY